MAATLENLSSIKRKLIISVPQAEADVEIKTRLAEVLKQVRLPGFRPGKAPLEVVRKQYGPAIRSEVVTKLIEKSYTEALAEHNLKPAGLPKIEIDPASFKEGDVKYTAELEVFPEFKVKGLSSLELTQMTASVTDEDLDKMFENLRKQHMGWKSVTRAAKVEDRIVMDFEGFKGKEAFEGGKAEDFKLVLGSKTMIPGFEDGLIDKKAGEEFDLALTFPDNYHVEDLKGAKAVFKIKVKAVEAPELPVVDETFAKLFEVDSLETLKKEVRMNMERELEFALKAKLKEQVIEGLLKHNEVELPEALVQEEAQRLAEMAKERMKSWGQQGGGLSELSLDLFMADAKKRVALGLIMNRIIQDQEIKPEQVRIDAMVAKMASIYDNPAQVIEFFKNNKQRMAEIEQVVLEEQVVEEVAKQAKTTSEEKSFDEVMQGNTSAMANILPQG